MALNISRLDSFESFAPFSIYSSHHETVSSIWFDLNSVCVSMVCLFFFRFVLFCVVFFISLDNFVYMYILYTQYSAMSVQLFIRLMHKPNSIMNIIYHFFEKWMIVCSQIEPRYRTSTTTTATATPNESERETYQMSTSICPIFEHILQT